MEPENEYDKRLQYLEFKYSSINNSLLAINQKLDKLIGKERKGFKVNEELKADRAENLDKTA